MSVRPGKLLLLLLIPVLLYAGLKGVLYYNAKQTVDDIVVSAANLAAIRYADISTDIRGSVTVSGISIQPVGYQDTVGIDAVRIASDDPLFFIRSAQWEPGQNSPPPSLSFQVTGARAPLSADIFKPAAIAAAHDESDNPCAQGLSIEPAMLKRIGFSELTMDLEGHYRIDEEARTLAFGLNMDVHDIESLEVSATMTEVDVATLASGGAPSVNLGGFRVSTRVSPEFGRQALKTCAMGSDETVQQWGEKLADKALQDLQQQGLSLGSGLERAVRRFYQEWGEFELEASPAQSVGLLSLMFLPPEQLANTLGLRISLNHEPITDTSFSWQRADGQGLSALLGGEQPKSQTKRKKRRVLVRRQYEPVAVSDLSGYVDHKVQIKPRGLPMREGLLKAVRNGEAEVQQILHGGKYTVYVPLAEVESARALIRRELPPQS